MLLDRVSNPGPLTYESGALPIALRSPDRTCNQGSWVYNVVMHPKDADGRQTVDVLSRLLRYESKLLRHIYLSQYLDFMSANFHRQ